MRRLTWVAIVLGFGYALGHRQGKIDAGEAMLTTLGRALMSRA